MWNTMIRWHEGSNSSHVIWVNILCLKMRHTSWPTCVPVACGVRTLTWYCTFTKIPLHAATIILDGYGKTIT